MTLAMSRRAAVAVTRNLTWSAVATVAAVTAHEAGHYFAARCYGLNPRIRLSGVTGHTTYAPPKSERQNAVITAAGPVAHALAIVACGARQSKPVAVAVAAASLARNLAPVGASDGQRYFGDDSDSTALRSRLYWAASGLAIGVGALRKDIRPILGNIGVYDLYAGRIHQWMETGTVRLKTRVKGFEM